VVRLGLGGDLAVNDEGNRQVRQRDASEQSFYYDSKWPSPEGHPQVATCLLPLV
jgi:hypothetical protein